MSNLSSKFQQIINAASKLSPTNNNSLSYFAQRINNETSNNIVILIDVSGSMQATVENGIRKIDILRKAVDRPLAEKECVVTFSNRAVILPNLQSIPEPMGNTDLCLGLEAAKQYNPSLLLLISDGSPDDKSAAIALAKTMACRINTLYIGEDDNYEAIAS